jgi:hypothetical protein
VQLSSRPVTCAQGEREATVKGASIDEVMERAIGWVGEMIAPVSFDYRRFTNPDL